MPNPQFMRNIATWAIIALIVSAGLTWATSVPLLFGGVVGAAVTALNFANDKYHRDVAALSKSTRKK